MLDRPQFVQVFIKHNFELRDMFYEKRTNEPYRLKWKSLENLYNDDPLKKVSESFPPGAKHRPRCSTSQKERLNAFERCLGRDYLKSEHDLDQVLRMLIGDYMKPIYTRSSLSLFEQLKSCCYRSQEARVADSRAGLYIHDDSEVPSPEDAQKEAREMLFRDLFLWAIVTHRIEIAKVLLCHMETRICALLIASKIFRSYLRFASDNESKDELASRVKEFEEYATECLKCCYNFDEEQACEIAIRRIDIYGGVSCLQVAVDADDKHFVGQPCCDQLLTNIWYDKIVAVQSGLKDRICLMLSIGTFGLLAQFLLDFRAEQKLKDDTAEKQRVDPTVKPNDMEPEQKVDPTVCQPRRCVSD